MISLSSLLTAPTQAQIRAKMVTALTAFGIPAAYWRAGGTFSTILTVISMTFGGFASLLSTVVGSYFLPTAAGPWLVLLAYYVYGITVPQATFASGSILLTNNGGSTNSYAAFAWSCANSVTGQTYQNTAPFTLSALGTATVPVQCTVSGTVGNSPPGSGQGTIDTIVTTMQSVSISTPNPIVGSDAPTDPTVRQMCLAALAARSYKGPSGAYLAAVYSAVNSVSGLPVNINRVSVVTNPDYGTISIYVAAPGGAPAATDVIGCQTSVNLIAEPMGITATVYPCTVVSFTQSLTVWATGASTGVTPATIESQVEAALIAYQSVYPIGGLTKPPATQGYLYVSAIQGVALGADSLIYAVDVAGADLALGLGDVADVTSTITVRQTS